MLSKYVNIEKMYLKFEIFCLHSSTGLGVALIVDNKLIFFKMFLV